MANRQLLYEKTAAPTVNDDDSAGYLIGDIWLDTTNDLAYISLDVTTGAAVWTDITAISVLSFNSSTITASNLTCAEDNVYNCTIAGLTANRNAVLPAPSAAGKQIRLNILDGDDTYVLNIIGDTGVTINGGSAATTWRTLQKKGDSVTLESTSTSNWHVIEDTRRKGTALGVQTYNNTAADGTTYYFGGTFGGTWGTAEGSRKIAIPHSGVITKAYMLITFGASPTNENWTISFRLNGSTDTVISSTVDLSGGSPVVVSNTALAITVAELNTFEIKVAVPTMTTNPTAVSVSGWVLLE